MAFKLISLLLLVFLARPLHAEVLNKIVAVVGNDVITEYELNRAMEAKGRAQKADANMRQEVLDRLIDDKLLNQILSKSKTEVSEDDLAKAIANILHRNRMSIEELKSEVAAKGMSYEAYKKQIEMDIRRIKFINQVIGPQVKISDQDLRDHYQRNQDRFRGGVSAHIAEIVLPTDSVASQQEAEALRDTALSIVAKARHGTSFESLAKQYSKGPNAEKGGDMGMLDLKDLPQEVTTAVRGMKAGDVSNPVLAGNAIVIIKVIALPEMASGDFEKMRDQIYEALYEEKIEETMRNFLAKERQKAFVEIR